MSNNTLDKEIKRLIDLSPNNKEDRKAILYSLVAVWLKYNENETYTDFCEFVKAGDNNFIIFTTGITDFKSASKEATVDEYSAFKNARAARAALSADAIYNGYHSANAAFQSVGAVTTAYDLHVTVAHTSACKSCDKCLKYIANQKLYYLIAAYLYLM